MTGLIKRPNWSLALGIPVMIFFACFLVTFTKSFHLKPTLVSNAIIADLLITAPLAYLFLIRKSTVSKFTVIRVFVVGLIMAGFILHANSNILLHTIKTWVSPFIEITIITIIIRKFYFANKRAKTSGNDSIDFLTHCRMVMKKVIGHEITGNIISSEIGVFYYAFFGKKNRNIDYRVSFSNYKENGVILFLATFLSLFLLETIGVHFLLMMWNKMAAWIISGLSFYTCIQLFAHIRAIKARPVKVNQDSVEIQNGLAGDATILMDNIEKFELSNKLPVNRIAVKLSLMKVLEAHNCIIYLKEPILVSKIFGIQKTTNAVLFFVDRPKDFSRALQSKIESL